MAASDLRKAFLALPAHHQERLLVVGLFEHGLVDLNVLGLLADAGETPARFAGLDRDAWETVLEAGAAAGLLCGVMESVYEAAPGLPELLAALWRERAGEGFEREREAALLASLKAYAVVGEWLDDHLDPTGGEGDEIAMEVLTVESQVFEAVAAAALERGYYGEALSLLEPLNSFWNRLGRPEHAESWVRRGLGALEAAGISPQPDTEAGALWFFLLGAQASRLHRSGALDEAEARYHALRGMLERSESEWARSRLAAAHHQLGMVAQGRGRLDAAEASYQQALAIAESLGDQPREAATVHQLGRLAEMRGDLPAADSCYRRSAELFEALDERELLAVAYRQLGAVARGRGDLAAAGEWSRKAQEIEAEAGEEPRVN